MKITKRIAFILAIVMIVAVFPAYGASAASIGDKLGNVLNSDIKVFINDNRIPSYNINNKTVIVAEDLRNYGFDVTWSQSTRSLTIKHVPGKKVTPLKAEDNTKTPGTPAFPYVYTDIVAYVEGKKVESFNVQGKTVIFFSDLSVYGTMKWDATKRHSMLYTGAYTPSYKVGDKLGSVLNSNIKAFINDIRIPSYNIANKTVVLADDLKNYGFDVEWNATTKSVYITLNSSKNATPIAAQDNTQKPGTHAFDYVYTDIVTYVNGKKVDSFNVQGKTAIYFSALSEYGTMQWDGVNSYSKLYTLFKVNGRVSTVDNAYVTGVQVKLKNKSNNVVATATPDQSGNYTLANVPAGSYTVEFSLSGYRTATSTVNISKSDVSGINSTLYRDTVTISGKIYEYGKSSTSNGLAGATVSLRNSNGTIVSTVTSGSDGTYSFENVAVGRYGIEAQLKRYESSGTTLFDVSYSDITNKNLTLTYLGTTVSGTISSYETGKALSNVTVTLKNSNSSVVDTVKTDTDGKYAFANVASGTYTIEGTLNGTTGSVSSFTVYNDDITNKNFSIRTSGYTVQGMVYTSSYTAMPDVSVKLINTSTGSTVGTTTTGTDGKYTFSNIPSGTYKVEATKTGYTMSTAFSAVTVDSNRSFENIYLVSGTQITGTVTSYYSGSSSISISTYPYNFTIQSSTTFPSGTPQTGNTVTITYTTSGSTYYATSINIGNTSTTTVTGTVSSYYSGSSSISISTYPYNFTINSSTTFPYGYPQSGSAVTITYTTSGSTYYATSISVGNTSTTTITGKVTSYYSGSSSISIDVYPYTFTINSSTTFPSGSYPQNGNTVTITYYTSGSTYYASSISVTGASGTGSVYGRILYIDAYSVTITTSSYGTLTFPITNATKQRTFYIDEYVTISYTGTISYNSIGNAVATSLY